MTIKTRTPATRTAVNLRTLVFNLDGTLLDSSHDVVLSFQYAFRVLGLPLPAYSAVCAQIGRPLESMAASFCSTHIAAICAVFCEYYPKHFADHTRVQPGVLEALETLRWRGYKLAVATTKRTAVAEGLLAAVGLSEHLDFVQGTDGFAHKPAPDVIYRLLLRSGSEGSWLVGDTTDDILAGRAAGLNTYAVTWGMQSAAQLQEAHPDIIAPDLQTLLSLT